VDFDPSRKARDERKERVIKNKRQQEKNLLRAQQQSGVASSATPSQAERKREVDRTLATTRASTASMGRFDRKLEGEKKLKGVKRKVNSPLYEI
jgi:regulator of ribosome biosynthesis